jgi:tRNA/tmRNA/rRNA uracil-C5-methylase (TrmA/RlmC/RlmD family)
VSFDDILFERAQARGLTLPGPAHPEPLAGLDYADERALKDVTLQRFWETQGLPGTPEPIVGAPLPRGYRTTTKRRVVVTPHGLAFCFSAHGRPRAGLAPSVLDAPEHLAVYAWLLDQLTRPASARLAAVTNFAIVRGAPGALAVVLNLRAFDGAIVRRAKAIGEALSAASLGVRSAFLYLDPSGSDYYLEARRPAGVLSFKRLFGPDWLEVRVDDVGLRFPPIVFSQVNGPMLPTMVSQVRTLLGSLAGQRLLDLCCGYGLFALTVGGLAAEVLGVDVDGPAIEAARANARHLGRAAHTRFVAGRLDGTLVAERLPRPLPAGEGLILDPPRAGVVAGTLEALAARRPTRVLHVFCGADEITEGLRRWTTHGYRVTRVVPLDLFAGTASVETLVLLTPDPTRRSARPQ